MCKEQGPPNYIYFISIYVMIENLSSTEHRRWAEPGLGGGARCHA